MANCFIITVLILFYTTFLGAQSKDEPVYFQQNFVNLELVRNQPQSTSQDQFTSGRSSIFVGFRHILRDRWLMSVQTGFKKLKVKSDSSNLSIFTIAQDSQYLWRINHPLYLSAGPKLFFMLPAIGNRIPPRREPRYGREIGLAFTASLHYAFTPSLVLSLRVDRWRGLNTRNFSGTETGLAFNVGI